MPSAMKRVQGMRSSQNLMLMAAVAAAFVMMVLVLWAVGRVARPARPLPLLDRAGWEAKHAEPRDEGAHPVSGDRRLR